MGMSVRGGGGRGAGNFNLKLTLAFSFVRICEFHKKKLFGPVKHPEIVSNERDSKLRFFFFYKFNRLVLISQGI